MECLARVCRACIATDVRLFPLTDPALLDTYQLATRDRVHFRDGLPLQLCWECVARMRSCYKFLLRCHLAKKALLSLQSNTKITEEAIQLIDRHSLKLSSTLRTVHHKVISNISSRCKTEAENDGLIKEEERFLDDSSAEEVVYNRIDCSDSKDINKVLLDSCILENEVKDEFICSPDRFDSDDEPLASKASSKKKEKKKKKRKRERDENGDKIAPSNLKTTTFGAENTDVIILSREQQLAELRSRKETHNFINSPHKCNMCYKGFMRKEAHAKHMQRHDATSGAFCCPVCQIRCSSERRLRQHCVATHCRKYACRLCKFVASTSHQAMEHDKWHKGYKYVCKTCGSTFSKSTTLLSHMRLRHPTQYVCATCGEAYVGPHGLNIHKKRAHSLPDSETFTQGESEAAAEVFCADCDVRFASRVAYTRHMATSLVHAASCNLRYQCRRCGQEFEDRGELHSHTHSAHAGEETHTGPQAVHCNLCEAKFVSVRNCIAHKRRMHLGIKYSVKKTIVCEICGKWCTSRATLEYHQRTHTGEKPFQCQECPKQFSIRQRLQIHERTHTGERPYPCPDCSKAFRHKPALNRHLRVHTGEKPYECNHCGKTFSQSNSMKVHVRTVHLKLPAPYRSKNKSNTLHAPPPQV